MDLDLTDADRAELARLIAAGCNYGILDAEDTRIAWSLQYEKFKRR